MAAHPRRPHHIHEDEVTVAARVPPYCYYGPQEPPSAADEPADPTERDAALRELPDKEFALEISKRYGGFVGTPKVLQRAADGTMYLPEPKPFKPDPLLFSHPLLWQHACRMLAVFDPAELMQYGAPLDEYTVEVPNLIRLYHAKRVTPVTVFHAIHICFAPADLQWLTPEDPECVKFARELQADAELYFKCCTTRSGLIEFQLFSFRKYQDTLGLVWRAE